MKLCYLEVHIWDFFGGERERERERGSKSVSDSIATLVVCDTPLFIAF